ncbi:MAG: MBL fold metallo-hydrolase [Gammaproteobacteria bacterium]|jgi:glyoxylase-like metal-dependent hydrolase (beta-lactamase superfamily II)/rhodanese-related sulfurtransferase
MSSLIFRQLQDSRSGTYTYLLADANTREAILIDPVFEQARRDAALVRELGLKLIYTLDTHVHADHVTGAWILQQLTGSKIALAAASDADGIDIPLHDNDKIEFGSHELEVRATPGHTDSCLTFVLDGGRMAFTGDALLIRGAGRTDFQQGNARVLYRSIQERIFTLPDDCLIYPAHDYKGMTSSSVAEEREFNPRIGADRSESDFVGYMENLGLPHPKLIATALPANMKCGHTELADEQLHTPVWGPLRYTYAGINEVEPDWVADHLHELVVLDVRRPDEYNGMLGHIAGSLLVPLDRLSESLETLDRSAATVAVCRSGGRSAQAVSMLEKSGFERVANLAGGMIAWNHHGLPVER